MVLLPRFIDKLSTSTRNEFVFIWFSDLATSSSNQEIYKEDVESMEK
jgi:hypothetical protein